MYTFVRAIAVEYGPNQSWKEVDISTVPTSTLFTKYRQMYAVITHSLITGEMTLDLAAIAAQLQANTGTISDYLTANGNNNLPTVMGVPVITRNNAVFSDAFGAGYDVQSVDYNVGAGVELPEELKPHLVVHAPPDPDPFDYLNFRKKVLANVNGFYHRTAADSRGFYIVDGNKTRLKSGKNYTGLLSFSTFGDLQIETIEESQLSFDTNQDTGLVDTVRIRFDLTDLTGKTPILFLGGYMVLLDSDTLLLTNSNVLTFKTRKYPFPERYFESKGHLDFDGFDPTHINGNPDWVEINAFKKEAFLRKYFTMSQSFLVLIDTQNLVVDKVYPEIQTVPHTFMSWVEPKWPLVVGEGKHEVYWKQEEAGSWVLRCGDTYKRNYAYQTTGTSDLIAIDNALVLGGAGRYGDGYFLRMVDEEVQIKTA